jgi:HEAT repeat protein
VDPFLLFGGVLAAAVTVGGLFIWIHHRTRIESWSRAAGRVGVTGLEPAFTHLGPELSGRHGDLRVHLQNVPYNTGQEVLTMTEIVVGLADRPLSSMGLTSERRMTTWAYASAPNEISIGDPIFDAAFWVTGSPAPVRAQLDVEMRRLLCRQDGWGLTELKRGKLRTLVDAASGTERTEAALRGLLEIATRLAERIDVPERLAALATGDPLSGVRHEALRALIREFPDDAVMAPTLERAKDDPDPEVRVRAAIALGGAEGAGILTRIADDPATSDATAGAAVSALDRRLPPARARELLDDALRRRRVHTARACLDLLGRGPAAETLTPLVKVLGVDGGEVARAAARALGALGDAQAEPALLDALEREVPGLRPDVAEALGRVGTVAAVLPLKEAAVLHAAEGDFARVARQAIAAIQSRASGAGQGQLTLAEDQAGRISLAEAEAGQLSLPQGERGRVSLSPPAVRRPTS